MKSTLSMKDPKGDHQTTNYMKRDKLKQTKSNYLINYNGLPLFCAKLKGVVGVPTNGDILGEPVISVHLISNNRLRYGPRITLRDQVILI